MSKNGKIPLKVNIIKCNFKNKDKKNMCKKLIEINNFSPESLLEISGQSEVFPVDVAQICYNLGIRLMPFDFKPIEEEIKNEVEDKGNILGAVVVNNDDLAILYRENDTVNRRRFTIAHELGHACCHMKPIEENHIEFRTDANSSNAREIAANIFAGKLLIPEKILNRLINNSKVVSENNLRALSDLFMVSENVMRKRLEFLKIKVLV